jgi:hypothetical protein
MLTVADDVQILGNSLQTLASRCRDDEADMASSVRIYRYMVMDVFVYRYQDIVPTYMPA